MMKTTVKYFSIVALGFLALGSGSLFAQTAPSGKAKLKEKAKMEMTTAPDTKAQSFERITPSPIAPQAKKSAVVVTAKPVALKPAVVATKFD